MSYVYWIHLDQHKDYKTEGYIGVAKDPIKRLKKHKTLSKNNKHPNSVLSEILNSGYYLMTLIYEDTDSNCYLKEFELRPGYRIGWNICPGGEGGSTNLGKTYSADFRKKRSDFMKNKLPVKDAVTGVTIGLVDREHLNIKNGIWVHTSKSKTFSAEHKEKIRLSTQGKNLNKKWWNNGTVQKTSIEKPGEGWVRGRLTYKGNKVNVAL
jgi:hypothetical protein